MSTRAWGALALILGVTALYLGALAALILFPELWLAL
jgi:hypothetical protein